jgi:Phosphotransferase enzyme family
MADAGARWRVVLKHAEATAYLLRHALITPAAIVEGDLTLADLSRRNHIIRVTTNEGTCYLLKQNASRDGAIGVAHEAATYRLLESSVGCRELSRHLPRCIRYDSDECLLVLELVPNAEDLFTYHSRRGSFPTSLAKTLGTALSAVHRYGTSALEGETSGKFSGRLPWVLCLDQPGLAIFRDLSGANLQVIRVLQSSPEFRDQLKELREGWQGDAFIHHDMKWDNCLAFGKSASSRKSLVKIIDWEFADRGDPCWDVGAMFGNYLSFWLTSIPITGQEPPNRFLDLARYPLSRMQPAICAYWKAYVRGMGLDAAISQEWLVRAMRYGATRLVQTGYEQMQASTYLTGNLVCLLQLALNILQRPHEAIVHLLGIPLGVGDVA